MSDFNLESRAWWDSMDHDLKELLKESTLLANRAGEWRQKFHDYSFVVFPAAKAYEGYLKKLFLTLGFINRDDYYGKRFRVGKALNPSLDKRYRNKESVYDRVVDYCGGEELAKKLWITWKNCRNMVFHWFPDEKNVISLPEARERIMQVLSAIDEAYKGCKIESK